MNNPLTIATDGYLPCLAKKALVIAVAGYLNFCSTTPPQPSPPLPQYATGSVGGNFQWDQSSEIDRGYKWRIHQDDEEILLIIKMWMKCKG